MRNERFATGKPGNEERQRRMSNPKAKKYTRFVFPLAVSGADPEHPGKTKLVINYMTLAFPRLTGARAVRKHMAKALKDRYGKAIPKNTIDEMFRLGVQHTKEIVDGAQEHLDKMAVDPDYIKSIAVQATKAAEERMAKEEPEI